MATVAMPVTPTMRQVAEDIEVPEGWRIEIIEGVIIVSPTPAAPHGRTIRKIEGQLAQQLPDGCDYQQVLGVSRGPGAADYSIPDLIVASTDLLDSARGSEIPPDEVLAVVEVVSPSSREVDRVTKARQYAASPIPIYLLVDPLRGELVVHSDPEDGAYQAHHRYAWGHAFTLPEPLPVKLDSSAFPPLPWRQG